MSSSLFPGIDFNVLANFSSGSLWGRVEEQSLWSSRQLGEQSPAALLRSLVYLNTKYFGLRTVEQHLRLSFANVYGPDTVHPVTKETNVCIRVPSISQDHDGEAGNIKMAVSSSTDLFILSLNVVESFLFTNHKCYLNFFWVL